MSHYVTYGFSAEIRRQKHQNSLKILQIVNHDCIFVILKFWKKGQKMNGLHRFKYLCLTKLKIWIPIRVKENFHVA